MGRSGPVVAVVGYTEKVPSKLSVVGEEAVLRAACTRDRAWTPSCPRRRSL